MSVSKKNDRDVDLLRRKQRGRQIFPKWKDKIEKVVHQDIDSDCFLGIKETDNLRSRFIDKVKNEHQNRLFFGERDLERVLDRLRNRLSQFDACRIVVFHDDDRYLGALLVTPLAIATTLDDLWRALNDDLCIATIDLNSGFCLERNFYNESGEFFPNGIFELTSWGEFKLNTL